MNHAPSVRLHRRALGLIEEDLVMQLLTNELREALPELYATEHDADPLVQAKFFATWSNWTWYVLEFDGEDTFFGLAVGHVAELGYFSLAELAAGRGRTQVERDLYFKPTPLSEVRRLHGRPGVD